MRKLLFLLLIFSLLVACTDAADTPVGDSTNESDVVLDGTTEEAEGAFEGEDVPRATEAPEPTTLPATWTPSPMVHNGHLYAITNRFGTIFYDPETALLHTVQPGETLAILCEAYDVSIADIARANGIHDIDHIEIGETLVIPKS